MSLEPVAILSNLTQGQILNTTIHNDIDNLVISIRDMIERMPKPAVLLKSANNICSSNVADGVLILKGPPVPQGHRARVEDFNVNFTTVAGTVRLVIMSKDDTIITDILRDINSSTNGTGATVLEEFQSIAIVGQTAGAGLFSVYCSGTQQRIN